MAELTKDTAVVIGVVMVDATDDETEETGLSPTVTISKNGGAFAAIDGSVAEISDGFYAVSLTVNDTDTAGLLSVKATGTGANAFRDLHHVKAVADVAVDDIDAATANKIADHIICRNWDNVCASSDGDPLHVQSLGGVLAAIVGDWLRSGNTITLYEDDGTTALSGSISVTTSAADTNPVTAQSS